MALTLDQVLGQLDIAAVAFQRVKIPRTMLPPAGPGQVYFIAVLNSSGVLESAQGPLPATEGQLLLSGDMVPRPGSGLVLVAPNSLPAQFSKC